MIIQAPIIILLRVLRRAAFRNNNCLYRRTKPSARPARRATDADDAQLSEADKPALLRDIRYEGCAVRRMLMLLTPLYKTRMQFSIFIRNMAKNTGSPAPQQTQPGAPFFLPSENFGKQSAEGSSYPTPRPVPVEEHSTEQPHPGIPADHTRTAPGGGSVCTGECFYVKTEIPPFFSMTFPLRNRL